jgi:hypothetical protein
MASTADNPRRSTAVLSWLACRPPAGRSTRIAADPTMALHINGWRPWRHSRLLRGGTRPVLTFSPVTSPTSCAGRRSPCCAGSAGRARSPRRR